ncbi:putative aldehyde dehydrogenase [Actinacidiphila reveromycinica]|uniref:Putative aldehyde dehydrogenase n=1 Tax=Actinacidiphila reveromycinica TaxID=659352 RepID=A0A7U3VMR9_9ACTN|nr:aldehyde dehydrogenase [Streptomyces sp. SN-593]BBA96905.1 putative aldehyde dehydrogenase [Streptomyces sp. SN-593]
MTSDFVEHQNLFIGGKWRRPHSTKRIRVVSANTERIIGSVPHANGTDVDTAVTAARAAFCDPSGWASHKPEDRAQVLRRFADALDRRASRIAPLVSDQSGMPIHLARESEAVWPGYLLRYYADLLDGEVGDQDEERAVSLLRRVPVGVVAAVVPWNSPIFMAVLKLAPALAAGCTVVLKPAPETVLDSVLLVEAALEAGLPDGALNVVWGERGTGAYLISHPEVDKVSFTGSTASGRWIGEVCGRLLRPVSMELSGKSAALVLEDADLDLVRLGDDLAAAFYGNSGQTCFLTARVLAPRRRYDEVVELVTTLARSIPVGNSLEPGMIVGPLVSARQRDRVEGYIAKGREEGARLVTGGGRPMGLQQGWFVEPTVFADVDNDSVIASEEILGPVVTITPHDGDEDAVRLANDSAYGLAATIWTGDIGRGLQVARKLETGSVGINGYYPDFTSPTTMIKASGVGLRFGPEALLSYWRYQAVYY